jgi:ClpP class serine protease
MPRLLFAMNEPELNAYISHMNNISLIRGDMAADEVKNTIQLISDTRESQKESFNVDESGVSHINIVGVLQPKVDPCAILFGIEATAYSEIMDAIAKGEANSDVKEHLFHFDTPGGYLVGLEKTALAIKNAKKPTKGIIHGQACSAGLFLGSQCDIFEAEGELCESGSLGVKIVMTDTTAKDRASGITKYTIVSENAPLKTIDPAKKEDRLRLKAHITKMEDIFTFFVADGRNTTPENVRKTYGKGATLLAREALDVGMIDSIQNEMTDSILENDTSNTSSIDKKTIPKTNTEDNNNMEMTAEEIAKIASDAATQASAKTEQNMIEMLDKRDLAASAETNRKAGFAPLLAKFPNQVTMITEEMAKPEGAASSDFTIKLMETESARLSAEDELKKNSGDKTDPLKTKKPDEEKLSAETDIAEMSEMMGVELPKMEAN